MELRRMVFVVIVVLAMLPRLFGQVGVNETRPHFARYTVRDLGTLGGTFSFAGGINDRGDVEGFSTLPGDTVNHAFLWRDGMMRDLGTLGGPNSWASYRPSNAGQVAGWTESSTPDPTDFCGVGDPLACPAFVWQKGVMTPLQLLGGTSGEANGLNNRGQIAGAAETSDSDPTCEFPHRQVRPVIWKDGKIQTVLQYLPGDVRADANAINDRGEVAGWTGTCEAHGHAVLWRHGVVTDLGSFGGVGSTVATDINNRTQVVGWSDLPGDDVSHAFLWENGTMNDLGTLPGDFISFGDGINGKGQIVGDSCVGQDFADCRPFLLEDGVKVDLNALIPSDSPLYLIDATGVINSRGQIAGLAIQVRTGEIHAFLATPCDDDNHEEHCWYDPVGPTVAGGTLRPEFHLTENARTLLRRAMNRRARKP